MTQGDFSLGIQMNSRREQKTLKKSKLVFMKKIFFSIVLSLSQTFSHPFCIQTN